MGTSTVEISPIGTREAGPRVRRRHPILLFVLRRVAAAAATLFAASILIFGALQVLPGDAAEAVMGRFATPERLAVVRDTIGLDQPLPERYADWLVHAVRGDFGNSTAAAAQGNPNVSVWGLIRKPLLNSVILAGITLTILVPLGLFLGAYTAIRAGRLSDNAVSAGALSLGAMPEFFIGTVLISIFFTGLNWFPPISKVLPGETVFTNPEILVLPITTLLAVSIAFTIRLVRATTIETLRQDYVAMARLNGIREKRVIWRFGLRNALAPSIQAIAQTAQYLVGGIIIVESVFAYPGIGSQLVSAVGVRDVTIVAAIAMILATAYVIINIIADLVVTLLVPKLRTPAMRRRLRIPRFATTPNGAVGCSLLVALVLLVILGPLLAPHPIDAPIAAPGQPPSSEALLGTDFLGRDVLSRLLHGGQSVFLLAGLATALSYLAGLSVGLAAGYSRSLLDPVMMRSVDVLQAFPALLILLLLVSGLGAGVPVSILGVAVVLLPGISRVVRSATEEVATREFVEAAVARGERTPTILVREILPNISSVVLADLGVRFGWAVILIANMNYLGFGLKPPKADWGLMISENQDYISLNPWAVLAPGILLALLAISVNLVSDAYGRSLGTSFRRRAPAVAMAADPLPDATRT